MEKGKESTVLASAAIFMDDGKVLVAKRRKDDAFGGKWEFPGGKLEYGEDPRESLMREISEELGADSRICDVADIVSHTYPDGRHFIIAFFYCELLNDPRPVECEILEWVNTSELESLDLLEADKKIIQKLKMHKNKPPNTPYPGRLQT